MRTKYTHETLIGKTFNALTYLGEFHRIKETAAAKWKCSCGNEIVARVPDVVLGKKKSCNCFKFRRRSAHPAWGGCGEISGNYWSVVTRGAKERNLELSITIEDAWLQFQKQEGKCALSGEPLCFGTTRRHHDITASLDRIDSSEGYTKTNIQWIHKDLNFMKMNIEQSKFIEWCRKVSQHSA